LKTPFALNSQGRIKRRAETDLLMDWNMLLQVHRWPTLVKFAQTFGYEEWHLEVARRSALFLSDIAFASNNVEGLLDLAQASAQKYFLLPQVLKGHAPERYATLLAAHFADNEVRRRSLIKHSVTLSAAQLAQKWSIGAARHGHTLILRASYLEDFNDGDWHFLLWMDGLCYGPTTWSSRKRYVPQEVRNILPTLDVTEIVTRGSKERVFDVYLPQHWQMQVTPNESAS
jgi:hypothetical protein